MIMSRLVPRILAVAGLSLGLGSPLLAQAVVRNHLYDKFQLSAGVAAVRFTTTIRFDTELSDGTEIEVEKDLGVDRTVGKPRFGARWNISRRHGLEFSYQLARRSSERELTKEIEYQGEVYDAGLLVRTKFDSDISTLAWRWAFHASDNSQIGTALGVGAILFRTGLDGYLSANDQQAEISAKRDITAPVGDLGVFGRWRLHPKWYLEADVRGLYIPVGRIELFVIDVGTSVRWFPLEWVGIEGGFGVNSVGLDVNQDPNATYAGGFSGKIRYRLAHPRLGVVLSF
jgi:hypothetical protein